MIEMNDTNEGVNDYLVVALVVGMVVKCSENLGGGNSNIFWNFHPENWGR